MKLGMLAAGAAVILGVGAAAAQQATQPAMAPAPKIAGYLGEAAPDTYRILPPAPVPGDPRDQADRAIFKATRSYEATPRWAMAQGDVNSALILKDMSCAMGVELSAQNAPKIVAILGKIGPDVGRATNHPKDIYKRPRPYLRDTGNICVPRDPALAASPDYPSGHNTWSWTVGLILAELAPDRATEILQRARAFGEGRLVCGVHSLSAVNAGRDNGAIVVAGLHGSAQFRSDMDAARSEVVAARKAGPAPDAGACAREAELIAKSPY
ncbi:MAG: acid phosphatase [Phenylobacterium sp.]|nr:acid phosphatase [Phenylobacterium sp.]